MAATKRTTADSLTTGANSGSPVSTPAAMFIFDVHTDPAKPRYVKTIDNFDEDHRRRHRTAWCVCVAGARAYSVSLERER